MRVQTLAVQNFRNYALERVSFPSKTCLILGANGQGKTNLVEALYFILQGESYRTPHVRPLVRHGRAFLKILLTYREGQGEHTLSACCQAAGKKEWKQDGQLRHGVRNAFNVVSISPEDDHLILGGPLMRRQWLDRILVKTDPQYQAAAADYQKALDSRNRLLARRERGSRNFDAWNGQFLGLADIVERKRRQLVERISPLVRLNYRRIAGNAEELQIQYKPFDADGAGGTPAEMESRLRAREADAGRTLFGPHLADLEIQISGAVLRSAGSMGQVRSAVFSLKMGQASLVRYISGKTPVLILDDVLMELDEGRQKELFSLVDSEWQIFITSAHRPVLAGREGIEEYHVRNGKIQGR